jgi:hypothetical protein
LFSKINILSINLALSSSNFNDNSSSFTIDLSKDIDKLNWAWMKHSPEIVMSFDEAQHSKANFYVHVEGIESAKSNKLVELDFEAKAKIMADPTSNYVNRALLLGMDMSKEAPATIKEYLFSVAEEDPNKILHIYRDSSMRINLLYLKAKRDKIITEDESGILRFSKFTLGTNEKAAVAFLEFNEDVLDLLEQEADPGYHKKRDVVDTAPTPSVPSNDTIEPSYAYMKAKAQSMDYTGSMKKPDVSGYLREMGIDMAELRAEEDAKLGK